MRASPRPPVPPGIILTHRPQHKRLPWLARVRDGRHRRYINKSHPTYDDASAWATEKQSELNLGLTQHKRLTIAAIRPDYITELRRLKLSAHYITDVDRVLRDATRHGCNDLTHDHLRSHVRAWLNPDNGLAPRTRNKHLAMYHAAINYAIAENRLRFDPLINFNAEPDPAQHKIRTIYNPTELALMVADHNQNHPYYPEACALVYLGLRVNEAANLMWSWFDFKGGIVTIHQDPTNGFAPKRHHERTIPIMAEAHTIFQTLKPRHLKPNHRLSQRDSKTPAQASRAALHYLRDLAAQKSHRFTLNKRDAHAIRHTWVSLRLALGVPSLIVKMQAGHKTVMTTEKYTHAVPPGWIKDWPREPAGEFRLRPT